MTQAGDRIAGLLGASLSLWWCIYQVNIEPSRWNLQAVLFYLFQIQVALLFIFRLKPVFARADMTVWLICGASLVGVYLIDFSVKYTGNFSIVGECLTYAGCIFSILAISALGKGFGVLPAFRRLASKGPYRIIRHPIYFGYALMDFGILLSYPKIENFVVIICNAGILIARIDMEESVCASTAQYREYMAEVRYRLLPGIY